MKEVSDKGFKEIDDVKQKGFGVGMRLVRREVLVVKGEQGKMHFFRNMAKNAPIFSQKF